MPAISKPEIAGIGIIGKLLKNRNIATSIFPSMVISVPKIIASGEIHETHKSIIPSIVSTGTTSATIIFANGDDVGTIPEKYIVYGSINIGSTNPNVHSSRSGTKNFFSGIKSI